MQVGLHRFHTDSIEWLRRAVVEGGRTRRQLAHELCERENWRNEKGELCLASARRILPKLAEKLGIALPPPRERLPQKAPTRDFPNLSFRCSLAEEVALEPVSGSADKERWRDGDPSSAAMDASAGRAKVSLDRVVPPWPAGRPSAPPGRHQKARGEFVGWSADSRIANLQRMVNNNRFLLLPGVRVHGLASHGSRPRGDATARRLGSRLRRASGLHLRLSRPAPAIVRQGGSVAASRHRGCRRAPGGGASRGR